MFHVPVALLMHLSFQTCGIICEIAAFVERTDFVGSFEILFPVIYMF